MTATADALVTRRSLTARVASAAALVAVLDLSFALGNWVVIRRATTVTRLLQSIATGLLGKDAFQGGTATAALGLLTHCAIATAWTLFYLVLVRNWKWLSRTATYAHLLPWLGVGYGVVVWLLMDFVILPLSRATPTPFPSTGFFVTLLAHVTVVGPPIVLTLRDGNSRARVEDPHAATLGLRPSV